MTFTTITVSLPLSARAAGDTTTCATGATIYSTDKDGQLSTTPLDSPITGGSLKSTSPVSGSIPVSTYPKVFATSDGIHFFGIAGAAGATQGISAWTRQGNIFTGPKWLSRILYGHSTAWHGMNDKISVDEGGYIFNLEDNGLLRVSRYDFTSGTWPLSVRTLASGWEKYNLIVAAGDGVIWAREASTGDVYRARFDPESQRLITPPKKVAYKWQDYRLVFSLGGDTLVTISNAGAMELWRYREDNNTWAVHKQLASSGWDKKKATNVWAQTNSCQQNASPAIPAPTPATTNYSPVSVTSRSGDLTRSLSLINVAGRPVIFDQANDDTSGPSGSVIQLGQRYVGSTQIWESVDGTLNLLALTTAGRVHRITKSGTTWAASDQGGLFPQTPTVVTRADHATIAMALDGSGGIWISTSPIFRAGTAAASVQSVLSGWRRLPTPEGATLTGKLSAVALDDGSIGVLAVDTTGTAWYSRYVFEVVDSLTGWEKVGGGPVTGQPSLATFDVSTVAIAARDAAGNVVVQTQPQNATAPSGPWRALAEEPSTSVGTPAIIQTADGRLWIATRTATGEVHVAQEWYPHCSEFVWTTLPEVTAAADPVLFPAVRQADPGWGLATYNREYQLTIKYDDQLNLPAPHDGCISQRAAKLKQQKTSRR